MLDGTGISWQPSEDAADQARRVLAGIGQPEAAALLGSPVSSDTAVTLRALAASRLQALSRFDPAQHLQGYRAKTFILHDRDDVYVPYVESEKLRRALPGQQIGAFLLSNLFQHANVKADINWDLTKEVAALYVFATAVLAYF